MSPMVPDCGVLTTPRRSPPLKLMEKEESKTNSPQSSTTGLVAFSPPRSAEATGVTLSSGFSFGFYKSPKNMSSPYRRPDPLPAPSPKIHKPRRDGINKGVGHKIKKPKMKAKAKEQKKRDVKVVAKRLKEGKFTPRLPADRSPVKTPSTYEKKKRHVLSSPGMSFLEDEDAGQDIMEPSSSKKFFTSRSRAAATVQLGKNIKLSAKNGDITLKQRVGTFEKRNVGRIIEDELNQFIGQSKAQSLDMVAQLPSVQSTNRPAPTRVPSPKKLPSPRKRTRTPSPRKHTKNTQDTPQTDLNVSTNSELQDLESILQEWDDNQEESTNEKTAPRRSPRKNATDAEKENANEGPRRSPRKTTSDLESMNGTTRKSPRKLISGNTPQKSPRRGSSRSPSKSSAQKEKYFSIFDPKRRLTDRTPGTGKNTNKSTPKRMPLKRADGSQMMIDAGQKEFGAKQCDMCGIIYEIGNPEDEASHESYHNGFMNSLKYAGWKQERQVRDLDHRGGRVILVLPSDPPHYWRKVEEIREIVDQELGFAENGIRVKENTKVFFYVLDKKIVGCLIAESINSAHKVIPQKSPTRGGGQLVCCSEKQFKVYVGISRIWVLASERGKGIASSLVNAMRGNMFNNHFLTMDEFAFSDPTENGMGFAQRYTQRRDFLVYRR